MDGEIEPEALRERLEDGEEPLLVDVSPAADFEAGHVPGSEHVPLPELPGEIDRIADAEDVVTVCPHGLASVKAARIIGAYREFDGTVRSLAGGLEAWEGPLEPGRPGGDGSGEGRDAERDAESAGGDGPDAPF